MYTIIMSCNYRNYAYKSYCFLKTWFVNLLLRFTRANTVRNSGISCKMHGHFLNETINISSNLNPACIDHLLHKLRMLWRLYNHFNSSTMFLAYSTPKIDAYFGLRWKSCYAPNMQDYQTKSGWIPAISSIRCIISEEV